jgi:hypothetical protein
MQQPQLQFFSSVPLSLVKNVLRPREYRRLKIDKLLVGYMQLVSYPAFYKVKKAM